MNDARRQKWVKSKEMKLFQLNVLKHDSFSIRLNGLSFIRSNDSKVAFGFRRSWASQDWYQSGYLAMGISGGQVIKLARHGLGADKTSGKKKI